MLFLLEGTGVGGKGVGDGVGATVWLIMTGRVKSYDATWREERNIDQMLLQRLLYTVITQTPLICEIQKHEIKMFKYQ
jgi:hypothetical protein